MKITCKYQFLFGQVQVQVQVLWHFHTLSTQVHQVLINMYLSTSTVLDPNPDIESFVLLRDKMLCNTAMKNELSYDEVFMYN